MKRFSILVALAFFLSCAACFAGDPFPAEFVGRWKLDEVASEKATERLCLEKGSKFLPIPKMGFIPTFEVFPNGIYRSVHNPGRPNILMRVIEKRDGGYVFRNYREDNPKSFFDTFNKIEEDRWTALFLNDRFFPRMEIRKRAGGDRVGQD